MAILISKGDTLAKIAAKYGTTVKELAKTNNIANPDLIYAGHSLMLPGDVPAHDHPLGLTQQPVPQDNSRSLPVAPAPALAPAPAVQPASRDLTAPAADTTQQPQVNDQQLSYNKVLEAMYKASQQDYSSKNDKMAAIRKARYDVGTAPLTENQRLLDPGALARSQEQQRSGYTDQLQGIESIINNDKQSNAAKITGLRDLLTAMKPTEVGGNLVNPYTGEVTYQGTPKEQALPASATEYEYAKKQGYKGTFTQYQNEDANRKRSVTNVSVAGETKAEEKARLSDMKTTLEKVTGKDGKLSPKDWNSLRQAWIYDGGSAKDFDSNFSGKINQSHSGDYFTGL